MRVRTGVKIWDRVIIRKRRRKRKGSRMDGRSGRGEIRNGVRVSFGGRQKLGEIRNI